MQQTSAYDVADVVGAPGEHDGLGAETGGPYFRHEGVDDGADAHGVGAQPDDAEEGLPPRQSLCLARQGEETDGPEDDDEGAETDEPDGPSTPPVEVEPGDDGPHERDAGAAEGDGVRGTGADAGLLEKEGPRVAQGPPVCDLGQEPHARYLGAAPVGAPERVPEPHARPLRHLEFVRVDHHGDGGVDVAVVFGFRQPLE